MEFLTEFLLNYSNLITTFLMFAGLLMFLGFLLILFIPTLFFKPSQKNCEICQKKTPDWVSTGNKHWIFCREHSLKHYSEQFQKNTFKIVMTEFTDALQKDTGDLTYTYYPLTYLKQTGDLSNYSEILKHLLDSIDQHTCSVCSNSSQVLYINKTHLKFKTNPHFEVIIPSQSYLNTGIYLCNQHALKRVLAALEIYPHPIEAEGGIWLPYQDNGFQTTVLV